MTIKRDWEMTPKQEKIFKNLYKQVEKHFNFKNHQQGFRGIERYREGLRAFCKHLAIIYQSQNFRNISDKHLVSFIEASKEAGVSPATLANDISAIRKLHSMIPKTRYKLCEDNEKLGLDEQRIRRGVDRAWRDSEVKKAVVLAENTGRKDVSRIIRIARYGGLRIEEATALTRTQLRDALRKDVLNLRITKNSIPRSVPLNAHLRDVFREILDEQTNERVFIFHGRQHHQVFKSIQNWIGNHREKFADTSASSNGDYEQIKIDFERPALTFHGLRHAYAREEYEHCIEQGMSEKEARMEVSVRLGHGRDEVTKIYLG